MIIQNITAVKVKGVKGFGSPLFNHSIQYLVNKYMATIKTINFPAGPFGKDFNFISIIFYEVVR